MKIQLDPGAAVTGPDPWRCSSCGVELEADSIDSHLVDHMRDRLAQLDPHVCAEPTMRGVLRKWWRRVREWWRR